MIFFCFKPYYNWTAFNTEVHYLCSIGCHIVLNLVISGIPSIHALVRMDNQYANVVLNLVISGIPSIQ